MSDSTDDGQADHDRFVERVKATGTIWGLKSDKGWAVCESNEYEETDVYPFWSDEAEARVHCTDDWAHFAPASLPLDVFIDTLEVEPDDLARELLGDDFQVIDSEGGPDD